MRITSLKLSVLAFVLGAIAIVPVASATTYDITVGTVTVGTATVTTSGMCGSFTLAAGDSCLSVTMTGGNQLRYGGDVIGLQGTLGVTVGGSETGIDFDSSGLLSISSHPCNSHLRSSTNSICITAGSGANSTTLNFVIDGTITNLVGVHIIGPACPGSTTANPQTCFASIVPGTPPPPTVPEPGTLGLLGTGLVGIAGLVRRRFKS